MEDRKFLNNKLREKFIGILVINAIITDMMEEQDKYVGYFGTKAFGWLKQASTLIVKSFREGLHPRLHEDEIAKVHKIGQTYKFALVRQSEPMPKEFIGVPQDALYDVAEFAIEKHCVGCTIQAHKQCRLYQAMKEMQIPVADRGKGSCPYTQ